ncbi:hypothetical protein DRP53_07905 [candidate division WOR-3 bacterium]|uniref:Glycosyltransferase subfamily 4-like N-terminal domain-containing protein n=1 Tax=candidate division WOR-3 bacterium TaxID=2052148 RepID=A0A660SFY1_UNCW3|nr:MAG: hypothetical protein DRP53_07905 [candidate division WOR-3 bacterium]
MRKVLIISYHFPPLGLAGSVRWCKFTKYLPRFGYHPIVLTVKPISYYFYDWELLKEIPQVEIYRSESLDPARIFYLLGKRQISPRITKSSVRFHQLVFPDAKSPWIPFAYQMGTKIINQRRPDIILATAPPYSSLIVGAMLKKRFSLPLILEFRDPWPTSIIAPGSLQQKLLKRLRKWLFQTADGIITVSEEVQKALGVKADIINHGYDPEDYTKGAIKTDLFYAGMTYHCKDLLMRFIQIISSLPRVRFSLAGSISSQIGNMIQRVSNCQYLGTLNHRRTMAMMRAASILVYFYPERGNYLTSKFYEYLGAKRPILALSSQVSTFLFSIGPFRSGIISPLDRGAIQKAIENLRRRRGLSDYRRFSFLNLTQNLVDIFNLILSTKI